MSARLQQVIVTELESRGRGVVGDPVRRVRQYWSVDGELLAEVDPEAGAFEAEDRLQERIAGIVGGCREMKGELP